MFHHPADAPWHLLLYSSGVSDRRAGRELHVFRGHQPSGTGFIMGHEFVGTVVEAGSEVQGFKVGDKVVAPFTVSW